MKAHDHILYGENNLDEGLISSSITVRDYIAVEAMNGMLVNAGRNQFALNKPEEITKAAYKIADAMIAERDK